MTRLSSTFKPHAIRQEAGSVFIGRFRLTREQQSNLLALWAEERCAGLLSLDEPTWRAAADLHGALLKAVLDADSFRRSAPVKPMSAFGAGVFEMMRQV